MLHNYINSQRGVLQSYRKIYLNSLPIVNINVGVLISQAKCIHAINKIHIDISNGINEKLGIVILCFFVLIWCHMLVNEL